jgi:hypothetical protein
MNTQINPFIYSRAVMPHEFVGREKEVRRLLSRLSNDQSTAIIGLPHVGKTSLINYVMYSNIRQDSFGDVFQYDLLRVLDAQMLRSVRSQAEFWEQALKPLEENLSKNIQVYMPLKEAYITAKENKFGTFVLEQLLTIFKENKVRLILFLDEFDDLLSHPPVLNSAEFYGSLRSLASRSLGLVLVLGSRRDLEQLNALTQEINPHGSPYFNVFTQITLATLPEDAFHELLDRGKDYFNTKDREYIRSVSGYHPLIVQAAAAKLWEANEEGLKDVRRYERAGRELYSDIKQNFSDTWRVWSDETRRVVTIVALTQIPKMLGQQHIFSLEDDLKKLSDYSGEIRTLEERGVLVHSANGWTITQGAFLWWLTDELVRNVRDETDFKSWLQAQEMDGVLTMQQKNQLSKTTSVVLQYLSKGATTLIEVFAQGAASATLKNLGY